MGHCNCTGSQEPDQSSNAAAIACYTGSPKPALIDGVVQHYGWGGYDFIPNLLGVPNVERQPFAELWLGAHQKAPAIVETGAGCVPLDQLISAAPNRVLGAKLAARYGNRLPYLLKVLDARSMLSIQAHPNKSQAEEGFARENAAGVPLSAPNRNYRDDNHKPEVHVALTEFWMLHGFRPLAEIAGVLGSVPEIGQACPVFTDRIASADDKAGEEILRDLYSHLMTMPQEQVDAALNPLIDRLEHAPRVERTSPDFWALRAAREFPLPSGHRDRGIFSVYLLNLVRLAPGQGTYQPAGTLHAYLEGVNVELMANSDNVLRGGLTPKHVDPTELMRVLTFRGSVPEILDGAPVSPTERVYRTPAREFEVSRIEIEPDRVHTVSTLPTPAIYIAIEGDACVTGTGEQIAVARGKSFLAPVGSEFTIETGAAKAVLFQATVPASA